MRRDKPPSRVFYGKCLRRKQMNNKRLFMVGGWTDLYKKIKEVGFHLTVSQNKEDITTEDVRIIDQLLTETRAAPEVVELAAAMHALRPFDAVVSFQEQGVMNAAIIGDRLGIAANPLEPVVLTRNKGSMRAHMAKAGLPSIPFKVVKNAEEVRAFAEEVGYPIILKPLEGLGSHHINKLYDGSLAAKAFAEIKADYPDTDPIAEKYMVGPEVSVEAISWNGKHQILAVTDKITTGEPYFVETGHTMPSRLPAETVAAIRKVTEDFLISIGHQHGPSHTEIIITDKGPIIVESHTRAGGDRISEMVKLTYGVDVFEHMLLGLLGADNQVEPTPPAGAAIRYLSLPPGEIVDIVGLEELRQSEGVVRVDFRFKVGDSVKAFTQSIERHGYVLATGKDATEAAQRAEGAIKKLQVVIRRSESETTKSEAEVLTA
ncbi:ATP-grasp domain-containing protein [Chitinimonas lacunae]|uniref:ATP-grasp domain-containing protein n=1 Tax=Chitinimonas lacunae TaxID=1963018 RepID=A0ABV8MRM9_9NEIS